MKRTLSLTRETLTELTADEMSVVVGGITQNCNTLQFCDTLECPTIKGCLVPTLPAAVCTGLTER